MAIRNFRIGLIVCISMLFGINAKANDLQVDDLTVIGTTTYQGNFDMQDNGVYNLSLINWSDGTVQTGSSTVSNIENANKLGGATPSTYTWTAQEMFYVAKDGSDTNDGKSRERAFLTFAHAINQCKDIATQGNSYTIYNDDGGWYTEFLDLDDHIALHAPNALLQGGMIVGNDTVVNLSSFVSTTTVGIQKSEDSAGVSYVRIKRYECYSSTGAANNSPGELGLDIDQINMYMSDSVGLLHNATGHFHIDISDMYLHNKSMGIKVNNGFFGGNILELQERGPGVGMSTGICVNDGDAAIKVTRLDSLAPYCINGGTLSLTVTDLKGTGINNGGYLQIFNPDNFLSSTEDDTAIGQITFSTHPIIPQPDWNTSGTYAVNQDYFYNNVPQALITIGTTTASTTSTSFVELMRTPPFPAPFIGWGEVIFSANIRASLANTSVDFRIECSTNNFTTSLVDSNFTMPIASPTEDYPVVALTTRNVEEFMTTENLAVRVLWQTNKGTISNTEDNGNPVRLIKRQVYPRNSVVYEQ